MMQTSTIATIRGTVLSRSTAALALAALGTMARGLRVRAAARRHRYAIEPDGTLVPFEADYVFTTFDRSVTVHARFADGRMRVGLGDRERPDVTVRLKDRAAVRRFFGPRTSPLGMLLANEMAFDGDLAYRALRPPRQGPRARARGGRPARRDRRPHGELRAGLRRPRRHADPAQRRQPRDAPAGDG